MGLLPHSLVLETELPSRLSKASTRRSCIPPYYWDSPFTGFIIFVMFTIIAIMGYNELSYHGYCLVFVTAFKVFKLTLSFLVSRLQCGTRRSGTLAIFIPVCRFKLWKIFQDKLTCKNVDEILDL